jgi:hypothetical protein
MSAHTQSVGRLGDKPHARSMRIDGLSLASHVVAWSTAIAQIAFLIWLSAV